MSLDVTVGGTTTQSYASVAEADAYLTFRGGTAAWFLLTTTVKEQQLQWAGVLIDTLYFTGIKCSLLQAMEWPRFGIVDKNGYYPPTTSIPQPVKNAQIEMAFQLVASDWSQGIGPITAQSVKVGTIEQTGKSHKPFPAPVIAQLKQFLRSSPNTGGMLVRG